MAQFLPRPESILIVTNEGEVYAWDTRVDRAIDFAGRIAGHDLSGAEWRQYVGSMPYEPARPRP